MNIAKIVKKKTSEGETLFFQNLEGHTEDCLRILRFFLDCREKDIKRFCDKWDLDREHLVRNMFLAIFLHDIGKLTEEFQRNISKAKYSPKYPHAFFSIGVILSLYKQKLITPVLEGNAPPVEACSILGHHTQLYDGMYEGVRSLPHLLDQNIMKHLQKVLPMYAKLGFDKYFSLPWKDIDAKEVFYFRKSKKSYFAWLTSMKNNFFKVRCSKTKNKDRLKAVYCYFTAILKLCDYYSSHAFHELIERYEGKERHFSSTLTSPEKYILNLRSLTVEQILGGNVPYGFQAQFVDEQKSYALLLAPCGRGKTEAALIWAQQLCKRTGRNKIIFAMPTQITSNAMQKRIGGLYGEDGDSTCGLFHGMSFIKLKMKKLEHQDLDELPPEYLKEIATENFKGNIFYKPITVTTIDHLIYSFVHGFRQADFALGNLQTAVIVFDEVHYYEKHTLEILLTLFSILRKMDIPYLLMSGTLPEFFIRGAKESNPDCVGPILDVEGLKFEPFKIHIHNKALVQKAKVNKKIVDEIVNNYRKGLVQFIILNTVKRSQLVYKKLFEALRKKHEKPNIVLHNSRFTHKDRLLKEKDIMLKVKKRPFILVATQVIEISLDISCDTMFTEFAPPDAIGQRGGRLNRKGKTWNADDLEHVMHVFLPEELSLQTGKEAPYNFDLLQTAREFMKSGVYSYAKLKEICDKTYANLTLEHNRQLMEIFHRCSIFGYSPKDMTYGTEDDGKLLQIREEKYQTINVIPSCYYVDNKSLSIENQVKIPLWWFKADLKENDGLLRRFQIVTKKIGSMEKTYVICHIAYDKTVGFDYDQSGEYSFIETVI